MRLLMLYSDPLWEWRPDLVRALRAALAPQLRALHAVMHVASATPTLCDECLADATPTLCDECLLPGALAKFVRCRCVCYCGAACQRAAWAPRHKAECATLRRVCVAVGIADVDLE